MKIRTITLGLLIGSVLITSLALVNALTVKQVMNWTTPVNTLIVFAFALLHGAQLLGWKRIITMFVIVSAISLGFESYGVASGNVYGPYHYTDMLGPKFLGLVPYLIPVAWFMMMYASYVIADMVVPAKFGPTFGRLLAVAAVAGIAMTAWDTAMDPMMVGGGHWVWEEVGRYFGIPLQNFWGWWLTTFTALAVYLILAQVLFKHPGNPSPAPATWVIFSYLITGLSTVAVDFIFDLDGPGMVGLFAMLPWIIIGFVLAAREDRLNEG